VDAWNLAFTIVAALAGIAAVIAAVWGICLQKSRYRIEDETALSIRVTPTRNGPIQLASFRVHNKSRRPVNVSGWYYGDSTKRTVTHSMKTDPSPLPQFVPFPQVIGEQELVWFLVSLQDIDWERITDIGITGVDGQSFPAPAVEWTRFVETAIRFRDNPPA
jgi:hypothetical protein